MTDRICIEGHKIWTIQNRNLRIVLSILISPECCLLPTIYVDSNGLSNYSFENKPYKFWHNFHDYFRRNGV